MSNYLNISGKLEASRPGLILGEDERYEINDDKNVILKVQNLSKRKGSNDIDDVYESLKLLLGEEALKQIEEKHPGATTSFSSMRVLFYAAMAAVTGVSIEEFEARFQPTK